MMNNKPLILIFAFNRLDCLQKTVESLLKNEGVEEFDTIFFCDGPRSVQEKAKTDAVRSYIHGLTGFKSISVVESEKNKGLGKSILDGVTTGFESSDKVIVLEDDLETSTDFLKFMEDSLNFYSDFEKVYSVSGFLPKGVESFSNECLFVPRISSLGWGIWKKQWEKNRWDFEGYSSFIKDNNKRVKFTRAGKDMLHMLINQAEGEANSWAIRCDFNRFIQDDSLTVYPPFSKVSHIGNDGNGTNVTNGEDKFFYETLTDSGYVLTSTVHEKEVVNHQFRAFYGFSFKSVLVIHLRRLGVLGWLKKLL